MVKELLGELGPEGTRLDTKPLRSDASEEERQVREKILGNIGRVRSAELAELKTEIATKDRLLRVAEHRLEEAEKTQKTLQDKVHPAVSCFWRTAS